MAVQVISLQGPTSPLRPRSLRLQDSLDLGVDPLKNQDSMLESIDSEAPSFEFADVHGKNIQVLDHRRTARRTQSFNQATVCVTRPLCKGQSLSVSIPLNGPLQYRIRIQNRFAPCRSRSTKSTPNGREQSYLALWPII